MPELVGIDITTKYNASGASKAKRDLRELSSEAGRTTKSVGGLRSAFGNMAQIAGGILGAQAVMGSFRAIRDSIAGSINMAADMESQLGGIAAVLGESVNAVAPLRDLITDLGLDPNLQVTAEQAAASIEMLARNGLTMEQIMAGAAKSTILLANSTGGSFATSADIATDALAQFNMQVSEMDGAVNQIVGVVNNSKFSIDDYGLAIAQAGGVAGAMGVEFEDFNTTIAAIAPLFASGSDAGTSYKTFIQRLAGDTAPAKKAMRELGIITEDGGNRFFDAAGNLQDMNEIAVVLHGALAGLSEQQANVALQTIFGTDAIRAAVGIASKGAIAYETAAEAAAALGVSISEAEKHAEGGITAFEALQLTIGKTDALEAARTRMDNLKGAFEIFGGVVDTIKLQIGDAFIPLVRTMTESLTRFLVGNQERIVGFFENLAGPVTTFMGTFTASLEDGNSWLAAFRQSLGSVLTFDQSLALSNLEMSIRNIGGAISTAVGNVTDFITEWASAQGLVRAGFDWETLSGSITISDLFTGTIDLKNYVLGFEIGDLLSVKLDFKEWVIAAKIGDLVTGKLDIKTMMVSTDMEGDLGFTDLKKKSGALGQWFDGIIAERQPGDALGLNQLSQTSQNLADWMKTLVPQREAGDVLGIKSMQKAVESLVTDLGGLLPPRQEGDTLGLGQLKGGIENFSSWLSEQISFDDKLTFSDFDMALTNAARTIDNAVNSEFDTAFAKINARVRNLFGTNVPAEDPLGMNTLRLAVDALVTDMGGLIPARQEGDFMGMDQLIAASEELAGRIKNLLPEDVTFAMGADPFNFNDLRAAAKSLGERIGSVLPERKEGDFLGIGQLAKAMEAAANGVKEFEWSDWLPETSFTWPTGEIDGFDWGDYVDSLEWPGVIIDNFSWDVWLDKLEWPDVSFDGWSTWVPNFTWPSVTWSGWDDWIPGFSWPDLSWPGWSSFIPSFPGWPDIRSMVASAINGRVGSALSNPNVNPLLATPNTPLTSGNIYTGGRLAMQSAASTVKGGDTTVNNYSVTVNASKDMLTNDHELDRVAKRLVERIRTHQR